MQLSLRLNAANCALRAKRYDQALAHSEAAIKVDGSSTKALYRKGQALQGLGRKAEAEAAYIAVLKRVPASPEANARLGEIRK